MDKQYGLFYYYGDTKTEELMDVYQCLEDAQDTANDNNDHIDCEDWEMSDCYFVRQI